MCASRIGDVALVSKFYYGVKLKSSAYAQMSVLAKLEPDRERRLSDGIQPSSDGSCRLFSYSIRRDTKSFLQPWQLLLLIPADWISRHQQEVIQYLKTDALCLEIEGTFKAVQPADRIIETTEKWGIVVLLDVSRVEFV